MATMSEPITHGGTDRGWKLCKCSICETVATCTPAFDFYTLDGKEDGLLQCESCFDNYVGKMLKELNEPSKTDGAAEQPVG